MNDSIPANLQYLEDDEFLDRNNVLKESDVIKPKSPEITES